MSLFGKKFRIALLLQRIDAIFAFHKKSLEQFEIKEDIKFGIKWRE